MHREAFCRTPSRMSGPGRFCCKSLFGATNENFQGRWRVLHVATWGTTSFLWKTTTDLRSGVMALRNVTALWKSPFARFSGSFDFRLLQQNRHGADIAGGARNVGCREKNGHRRSI